VEKLDKGKDIPAMGKKRGGMGILVKVKNLIGDGVKGRGVGGL